jgi:site-specific DNA-methyltransferase (adenine-specific)
MLKIEYLKIDDLTPYEKNTRKHQKKDVDNIARSIKKYGMNDAVGIWGEKNIIVEGHGRVMACKQLGIESVPCVRLDHLTDEQRREYAIAHNATAELSAWDLDNIVEELKELDLSEFDFNFGVFTEEEQEAEEDDFDVDSAVPEEPEAKLGYVYQLGRHRLMCGDSTKIEDVQKLCADAKIDMLLTDPPYNVNYEGTAGKIKNDNMEDSAFRQFLRDAFTCAKTVMKPGAAFHIWHADSEGYNFRGACIDVGFKIRQCLIWVKNSLVLGRQDFQWRHEPCLYGENPLDYPCVEEYEDEECQPCLYGWKDGSHYWFKNRKQTTVLEFDKPRKSAEHPTMKPVKLFDYEMKCNTRPGENVLDLFGGSGTTIVAAEQNGRNAFVMEFDPKFVDVIVNRWETLTGEKAVLLSD